MATIPTIAAPVAARPKKKGSKSGLVASILGLIIAGISNFVVHAPVLPSHPHSASAAAVETATGHVLLGILGLFFVVVAFALATLGLLLALFRLRRGLALSLLTIGISFWTFQIVMAFLNFVKAK